MMNAIFWAMVVMANPIGLLPFVAVGVAGIATATAIIFTVERLVKREMALLGRIASRGCDGTPRRDITDDAHQHRS